MSAGIEWVKARAALTEKNVNAAITFNGDAQAAQISKTANPVNPVKNAAGGTGIPWKGT